MLCKSHLWDLQSDITKFRKKKSSVFNERNQIGKRVDLIKREIRQRRIITHMRTGIQYRMHAGIISALDIRRGIIAAKPDLFRCEAGAAECDFK